MELKYDDKIKIKDCKEREAVQGARSLN